MAYCGGGRRGRRQRPPYGHWRGGSARQIGFVWPPRTVPAQYQAAYGAPASMYRPPAVPQVSSSPTPHAVPLNIRVPQAPWQLAHSAPARASEPIPASSPPSAAALAEEVVKKLLLSETALAPQTTPSAAALAEEVVKKLLVPETALAPPDTSPAAVKKLCVSQTPVVPPAVAAAAHGAAAPDAEDASYVDLAPVSKGVPKQTQPCSAASAVALAEEVEKKLFVSKTPPAAVKVLRKPFVSRTPLVPLAVTAAAAAQGAAASNADGASNVDLATVSNKIAHPARRGLGTVGMVMIRVNHFLVDVANNDLFHYDFAINPESKSRTRNREVFNELIKLHGKTALGGKLPAYDERKCLYTAGSVPFESKEFKLTLVDPKKEKESYVTASRSFFSTTFGRRGDINKIAFYISFPDIFAICIFKPMTVMKFVEEFLSICYASWPFSDRDHVKIKNELHGVCVETNHQPDQTRRYKITGITPTPMNQLLFTDGGEEARKTVVQYFWEKYNYRLKYGSWPCLQADSDSRPIYLPMKVCKITEGQRYSKKFNDKQVANILTATCKRPKEMEQSIRDSKYHDSSVEKAYAPIAGQWRLTKIVRQHNIRKNASVSNCNRLANVSTLTSLLDDSVKSTATIVRQHNIHKNASISNCNGLANVSASTSLLDDSVKSIATVNIHFCRLKLRVPATPGTTVMELVQSALLKHDIRCQDFYIELNGRLTDGDVTLNGIPNLDESIILVCPRLRGGAGEGNDATPSLEYKKLSAIINDNPDKLSDTVRIDSAMRKPTSSPDASFLSELAQYIIYHLLVLVCREGHLNGNCYYGRFNLSNILMSRCGHMRFSSAVKRDGYTQEGADLDYQQLHNIVLTFVDMKSRVYPVQVDGLLYVLRNAPESLRREEKFVAFLINHPCLLTSAERYKLYNLVDSFLYKLLNNPTLANTTDVNNLDSWLNTTTDNKWLQDVRAIPYFDQNLPNGSCDAEADHCLRFGRNNISHTKPWVGLEEGEVALTYLLPTILPKVIYNVAKILTDKTNIENFIAILSEPRADRTTVRRYWS